MTKARLYAVGLACTLTALVAAMPASAVKGGGGPQTSIVVDSIRAGENRDDACAVVADVTSVFKGKAPSVVLILAGEVAMNFGTAVKGVSTQYSLGTIGHGAVFSTSNPITFELRDSRGRVLARDEETTTIECIPPPPPNF